MTPTVTSDPGRGTQIRLLFERATSAEHHATVSPAATDTTEPERILVVDDDGRVRETLHDLLTSFETEVHSAASPAEAQILLEQNTPIDCLITDLTMPAMNGCQLIDQLRRTQPDLPAILITGAGSQAARQAISAANLTNVEVVTKPFRSHDLREAIHSNRNVPRLTDHRRDSADA